MTKSNGSWRDWLSYPEYIPIPSAEILDTIEKLQGISSMPEDRYSAALDFLNNAKKSGIISQIECDRLKTDIAQQL